MTTAAALDSANAPIAIVGIACRLPGGADRPERLWELLRSGVDAVGDVPEERWHPDSFYHPDPSHPGTSYTKAGAFLPLRALTGFDASFFGISPHEAERMSPHQRLLLEMAWEACEDAGWNPRALAGSATGVYVGQCGDEYGEIANNHQGSISPFTNIGGAASIAANRVSHVLDLHGPSFVVDTACSSALVALHLACTGLWRGECTQAFVGASTVHLREGKTVGFAKASMLSRKGHCHAFSADADGFVRAEGGGLVVLKPLAAAEADGDRIYAVLVATGVNQAGHTTGISLPSEAAQAALLAECCRRGGVDPAQVHYVEAHGTGTPAGDPIECAALGQVFGTAAGRRAPLRIGSVKSNIGHLEGASGLAGLIKVALALWTRELPANLHLQQLNPNIPFAELGLQPMATAEAWPETAEGTFAGINSFGFGGSNAHALLRPYTGPTTQAASTDPLFTATAVGAAGAVAAPTTTVLVPFSAASLPSLKLWLGELLTYLRAHPTSWTLTDLASSLAHHRAHHDHRLGIVAASIPELCSHLAAWLAGESSSNVISGRCELHTPRVAAVFCGNGPQWWGMARTLLDQEPLFRTAVDEVDALYRVAAGVSIRDELARDEATSRMDRTDIAQPALFAIQVGLWRIWRSWGITPEAVTGHSVGEVAAAWAAGALSLPAAVQVIYHRSRCQELTRDAGTMAALGVSSAQALAWCAAHPQLLSLAAENSPAAVTISGDRTAIQAVVATCAAQGHFARTLALAYAFHSPAMEPIRDDLLASLAGLPTTATTLRFISTVTGREFAGERLDGRYWWNNVRLPVRFQSAITGLVADGCTCFIEIGPHPVLRTYLAENIAAKGGKGLVVESLKRKEDDRRHLLRNAGALWARGITVAWDALGLPRGALLRLPPYAWDRIEAWHLPTTQAGGASGPSVHPLLGQRIAGPDPLWECPLDHFRLPWLRDHQVGGTTVLPGTAYVAAAHAAGRLALPDASSIEIDHFVIHRALAPDADTTVLRIAYDPRLGQVLFHARSGDSDTWTLHAEAIVRRGSATPAAIVHDLAALRQSATRMISAEAHYAETRRRGLQYGPLFQGIARIRAGAGDGSGGDNSLAIADLVWPANLADDTGPEPHPAILDAAVQSIFACLQQTGSEVYLPVRIERVRVHGPLSGNLCVIARIEHISYDSLTASLRICTPDGSEVMRIDGFRLQSLALEATAAASDCLHGLRWETLADTDTAEKVAEEAAGLPAGRWLILADRGGLAERFQALSRTDTAAESDVILVGPGAGPGTGRFSIHRGNPGNPEALLDQIGTGPWRGIIDFSALDAVADEFEGSGELPQSATTTTTHLVLMVQTLALRGITCGSLTVITRSVHGQGQAHAPSGLAQSPLWGVVRCLAHEHPELHPRIIDLSEDDDSLEGVASELALLRRELFRSTPETELLLRGGLRLAPRLVKLKADELYAIPATSQRPGSVAHLVALHPGQLDSLRLVEVPAGALAAGDIRVAVAASGVNFKDVMIAMGLLNGDVLEHGYTGPALGMEFAGTVIEITPGETRWKVGDRVAGFARHSIATQVVAPAASLVAIPAGMSDAAAATTPIVFLTAWYALAHVARLSAGETVLVHGAAGGVGLAAIQVAALLGARVIASAGSTDKRTLVQSLGVAAVIDSRDRGFDQAVLDATDGKGVDVVLNSLAGDAIARGIAVLKPFGRFIELGKRDFMADTRIGLRAFRRNLSFHGVDVDQLLVGQPALVSQLIGTVAEHLAQGHFAALPHVDYPVSRAEEAFRLLQQSKQIGKVIVTLDDPAARVVIAPAQATPDLGPGAGMGAGTGIGSGTGTGTWLVTGGLSGFGLATAQWLVASGVTHLVLVGRRGQHTPGFAETKQALLRAGVTLQVAAADVGDEAQMRRVLHEAKRSLPPICGVVHGAMVLDDGIIRNLNTTRLTAVLRPKIDGAWVLHRLTRHLPLRHFIVYSSVASLIGNPGQAAYVAANAFLESLVATRRALGLPGTALCWGPIADTGVFARSLTPGGRLPLERAFHPMTAAAALIHLGAALRCNVDQLGVFRADWGAMPGLSLSRLRGLLPEASGTTGSGEFSELIAEASGAQLSSLIEARLATHLGRILGLGSTPLDHLKPIGNLGLDSLMAVELGHVLETDLGVVVPMMKLIQNRTTEDMARELTMLVEHHRRTAAASAGSSSSASAGAHTSASPSTDTGGDVTAPARKAG